MLHVHRAERADRLADGLAEVLREAPADAFAVDVVAVPARGVERWLTQRLSHVLGTSPGRADGVCANVRFPSPEKLVNDVLATVSGVGPAEDPWQPRRIVWPLLEVVAECAGEPWCTALGAHLGVAAHPAVPPAAVPEPAGEVPAGRRGRLLTSAQHLAGLYESYGASRPGMLRAWAGGADVDGAGAVLGPDLAWQAELWRRMRVRIGTPSPAERLEGSCAQVRDQPELVDLPARLSVFGPTRLTEDQLAVLAALAAGREVHLWLPHPSPVLWDRVRSHPAAGSRPRRRADPTARIPCHPLLSALGRDARELQLLLAAPDHGDGGSDAHLPVDRPATLLGALQSQLRDDRPPKHRTVLDPADRSVQVHACHGPARQVEVLREVLLGLLAADDTLEPRDVLVMCPDIEAFAPLITAAFGAGDDGAGAQHPAHQLRVRLADRSLRQTNPLLAALARVLDLADARVTASQVLDLAALPPVRRRFDLDDDDVDRIRDWVGRAGIRWGLDGPHRGPFRLERMSQNTWEAGLDRILLGAAMAEDDQRWLGLALPLDDVDSGDIDLAGRLAELVDRLGATLDALAGERPLAEWLDALSTALDALTSVSDSDGWQLGQARRELADVAAEAGVRATQVALSLPDVRALLAGRLRGRPTRANFRTGSLTMCSLVPMRSVPHRVICLLGLDDGVFPRGAGIDGDDVLARDPCVGERDRRSEERQLLLDAFLAAREHLVVLFTGADDRTNARRLPAVPVGEILDAIDATVTSADGSDGRCQVVVHHPLQPFDDRNFVPGGLGTPGFFSFDRPSLAGARAAARPRRPPAPFLAGPLPAQGDDGVVELANVWRFLEHPVRGFLSQRLGVSVLGEEEEVSDALSAELGYLESWAVGDRLLAARLAGADASSCQQAEWRRGTLPPGPLGRAVLDRVMGEVELLVEATAQMRSGEARTLDVARTLPAARREPAGELRLTGTVPGGHDRTLVRVVYSRLGAKHRLRAWVQVLALAASRPQEQWQAVTVGRGPGRGVRRSTLVPPLPELAVQVLGDLLDLHRRGLCEPLPLAAKSSCAYATARSSGRSAPEAAGSAAGAWTSDRGMGEADDRHHQLVWGPAPDFGLLLADPPRAAETGPGWPGPEPTRFGALARRLWDPLLAAETVDAP